MKLEQISSLFFPFTYMSLNLGMTFSDSVAVTVCEASLYPQRFQNRKPEHISAEDRTRLLC